MWGTHILALMGFCVTFKDVNKTVPSDWRQLKRSRKYYVFK